MKYCLTVAYSWSHNFKLSRQLPLNVQQLFCFNTLFSKPPLPCSVGSQQQKKNGSIFACDKSDRWCLNIIFLPMADASWGLHLHPQPGRPPVVRGNLTLRWEGNHFPCLHEYRSPTPQKNPSGIDFPVCIRCQNHLFTIGSSASNNQHLMLLAIKFLCK